jgi:hypothetical protein
LDNTRSDYFLGKSTLEAVQKGREKYPGTVFYCIRIGHRAGYEHRGGIVNGSSQRIGRNAMRLRVQTRGRVIFDDDKFLGKRGQGEFLKRGKGAAP